jgi:Flp pilus assembly pilin Flp
MNPSSSTRRRPKSVSTMRGWKITTALCVVGLLAAVPPKPLFAGTSPLVLDLSFNIGPIAAQLNITNPVAQPGDGGFKSTLHIHARDDTQTPPINADLIATGHAADVDTLLGGFLPAAIIVEKDLVAGMTFDQAAADAQAKTGVTVSFLHDPTAVEYAVMLALIIVVCITAITRVQPGLGDQTCTIRANLEAGLAALGVQNPPDPCATRGGTP